MNARDFGRFVEETGLSSCRRGFVEEAVLFGYFGRRAVADPTTGEVFERLVGGDPLLFNRGIALGIGYELCAAGAPFDGGIPG